MDDRSAIFFQLDGLAEYESSLNELYAVFAEKFPGSRDLWLWLSEEESHHQAWVEAAKEIISSCEIKQLTSNSVLKSLDKSLNEIKSYRVKLEQGELDEVAAMKIAYQIENQVIENDLLGILNCDNDDVREYYEDLMRETSAHRDAVKERIKQLGSN